MGFSRRVCFFGGDVFWRQILAGVVPAKNTEYLVLKPQKDLRIFCWCKLQGKSFPNFQTPQYDVLDGYIMFFHLKQCENRVFLETLDIEYNTP